MKRILCRAAGIALAAAMVAAGAHIVLALMGGSAVLLGAGTLVTDTAMTNAMKVIFDRSIVVNVIKDSEILDLFQERGGIKTDTTTGGRYIETAQLFGLNAGFGARADGDYIPVPSGPTIVNARVTLKKLMGSVEISGDTLKRVRTDDGAFVNWADQVMPNLLERANFEMDRMLLGYGSAIKAMVNAATPATNLVVDSPFGVAGWDPGALYQFMEGDTLKGSANADGSSAHATVYTVLDVDHENGYIVVDAVTTLADDDYLFPADAAGSSAGLEPMGLAGIADDGNILATFQNIARASYSKWRSLVVDAQSSPFTTGQTFTESLLLYCDDTAFSRHGAKIDTIVTSRLNIRQYWNALKGDRRINDPRGTFTGGKSDPLTIHLGDRIVELRAARKCPDPVGFGVTRASLAKWMLKTWEWDDTTGSVWKQVTDATGRKDQFYAYGTMHLECGSRDPQKNWRVENVAATVPTT
jgi:hypothetical protein